MLQIQHSGSTASTQGRGVLAISFLCLPWVGVKNLMLAAMWASENQQQWLNAGRSSNKESQVGVNDKVWLGLDSLGGLGKLGEQDASNQKG